MDFVNLVGGPGSEEWIIEGNFFIECSLLDPACGGATSHDFTDAEKAVYRAPFEDRESRDQIRLLPLHLPFLGTTGHPFWDADGEGGDPAVPVPDIEEYVKYAQHLSTDDVPKLFIRGVPGLLPNSDRIATQLEGQYPNLQTAVVGSEEDPVRHFIAEDAPNELGAIMSDFIDAQVAN